MVLAHVCEKPSFWRPFNMVLAHVCEKNVVLTTLRDLSIFPVSHAPLSFFVTNDVQAEGCEINIYGDFLSLEMGAHESRFSDV